MPLLFPVLQAADLTAAASDSMNVMQALVLGVVQGLTEYIPVSSTAHLRIVPALLGWGDPGAAFSAVIQLGTLAAVLVYFMKDIQRLALGAVLGRVQRHRQADGLLAWKIALGNVPIVVMGLAFKHKIENEARSLILIAAMLMAVAVVMVLADRLAKGRGGMTGLSWTRALAIGLFQALALIPGTSRSGITIVGGLFLGLERSEAARFSFLLGIPAILGSGLFELKALVQLWGQGGTAGQGAALAAGVAGAAVVGYLTIGFLLNWLKSHSMGVFAGYRLALGGLILWLATAGMIQ
ncbi:MAG: undecaprenyl-diphosphatase UppP [Deltaproteobacteria bacterium]|nr:undecaprenyl-diphosphatase UppP [Deltaproteobacteria bacterium]